MKKIYEGICRVEAFIAKFALVIISLLVFAAAIARTIRYPIPWAVDVATFLFAWCVFFSGDLAMRQDKLVSIDMVINMLPKKVQHFLKLFNWIVIIIFLGALIGFGIWLSYTTRFRTFQGIPQLSYTWVTLSVPVGCLLMLVTAILKVKALVVGSAQSKPEAASAQDSSCPSQLA